MAVECGNIHKVVHQCRIAKTRADDLQAFVKEFVRHSGVESCGEIRTGDVAVTHGVEDHVGQRIDALCTVRLYTADADIDHIVAARPPPLLDFYKCTGDKLLRHLLRQRAGIDVVPIVGIEVLIHPSESLRVFALQYERDVTEPHKVQSLPE